MCVQFNLVLFLIFFFLMIRRHQKSTLFPYTTLFRSCTSKGNFRVSPSSRGFSPQQCTARPVTRSKTIRVFEASMIASKTRIRSEEHTSELQSHVNLVCRLLLEKKKKK